jgi:hypothetical protein
VIVSKLASASALERIVWPIGSSITARGAGAATLIASWTRSARIHRSSRPTNQLIGTGTFARSRRASASVATPAAMASAAKASTSPM